MLREKYKSGVLTLMFSLKSHIVGLILMAACLHACAWTQDDAVSAAKFAKHSVLASDLATTEFGYRFCDEVVDGLQRGSYHWLSCRQEVERLANSRLTQLQMVDHICEAIKYSFEATTSVDACKKGGTDLIAKDQA